MDGRRWPGVSRRAVTVPPVLIRTFPRRQQARRLRRAAASGAAAIAAVALTAIATAAGATAPAGLLAMIAAALVLDARGWVRQAARSRVGAQSEAQVRRALGGLGGRGMAAPSLAPLEWARRYRQRRDRPDRGRVRDRFLPLVWSLRVPFVGPLAPQDPLFSARVSVRLACCS